MVMAKALAGPVGQRTGTQTGWLARAPVLVQAPRAWLRRSRRAAWRPVGEPGGCHQETLASEKCQGRRDRFRTRERPVGLKTAPD